MEETTPALWFVVATGAASGLLASVVTYALLGRPAVKVKTRHALHIDPTGSRVDSRVTVTNARGRPVKIEHVWLVKRRPKGGPGMGRPRGWTFPPGVLSEGESVAFTFEREDFPNALPVAIDSVGRIWPRRRWLRVKRRALQGGPIIGWPWQRNGPTDRQIERAMKRLAPRFSPPDKDDGA